MKEFPIPVRATGPGSQPEDTDFSYLPFPRDVPTFSMPQVPDAEAEAMARAHSLLARFVDALGDRSAPRVDLAGFHPGGLEVLNQTLGEGEVAIRIDSTNGETHHIRIQETVFAGVWRERHYAPDGGIVHDYLHGGAIPPVAVEMAQRGASSSLADFALTPGAMNAPALLAEIRHHVKAHRAKQRSYVINLTLLPLTPDDMALLDHVIPPGPVTMLSRGFGNCRITSTGLRNLWRVQYFNSMQTLILNTLEIVEVPEVALAAAEDLAESRERLVELVDWMGQPGES
ncbi:MAG: hydrogenase expression/formation C-terminal domain-containing protein [Gemmatimonadota bacterium]